MKDSSGWYVQSGTFTIDGNLFGAPGELLLSGSLLSGSVNGREANAQGAGGFGYDANTFEFIFEVTGGDPRILNEYFGIGALNNIFITVPFWTPGDSFNGTSSGLGQNFESLGYTAYGDTYVPEPKFTGLATSVVAVIGLILVLRRERACNRGNLINILKLKLQLLGIGVLLLTASPSANASLIGSYGGTPTYPMLQFENFLQTGINYDPNLHTFNLSATPGAILLNEFDSGTLIDQPSSLEINITVNQNGGLTSGASGFDLEGTFGGHSGTLLKGDVEQFGWDVVPGKATSPAGYSDNIGYFDFGIHITGGLLASDFPGSEAALFADSTTTFTGSFATPFDGLNEGIVMGLVPVPEPTTMIAGALPLVSFGVSAIRLLRKPRTA